MLLKEFDEVGVLSHDDDVCQAGGCEDLGVGRALQIQIANSQTIYCERVANPSSERRRELIIEPECHAATMG